MVTEKQMAVLRWIEAFIEQRGYPPTMMEICQGMGYRTTSHAKHFVDRLVCAGRIERTPKAARGMRVISNQ